MRTCAQKSFVWLWWGFWEGRFLVDSLSWNNLPIVLCPLGEVETFYRICLRLCEHKVIAFPPELDNQTTWSLLQSETFPAVWCYASNCFFCRKFYHLTLFPDVGHITEFTVSDRSLPCRAPLGGPSTGLLGDPYFNRCMGKFNLFKFGETGQGVFLDFIYIGSTSLCPMSSMYLSIRPVSINDNSYLIKLFS